MFPAIVYVKRRANVTNFQGLVVDRRYSVVKSGFWVQKQAPPGKIKWDFRMFKAGRGILCARQ